MSLYWFYFVVICFLLPDFGDGITENDSRHNMLASNNVGHSFFLAYRDLLQHHFSGNARSSNGLFNGQCVSDLKGMSSYTKLLYVDAAGKPNSGLFFGNSFWMGSVSECRNISNSHYCVQTLTIKVQNQTIPITWSACFPASCNATYDIPTLLEKVISFVKIELHDVEINVTSSICPPKPSYTTGVKVALAISGFILFLCLLGTIVDCFIEIQERTKAELAKKTFYSFDIPHHDNQHLDTTPLTTNDHIGESTTTLNWGDNEQILISKNNKRMSLLKDFSREFILCFSLLRNSRRIFNTDVPATAITCINGMRVLSITWVILGHTFMSFVYALVEDRAMLTYDAQRLSIMPIINGFYSVDSFFFLSGLLVAYTCMRKMQKSNGKIHWGIFLVHRFFRLTPTYMYVILFSVYLKRFLSSGPLYYIEYEDKACSKYWWTNLLYINNFYPRNNLMCIGWSWYLANDMQFFIITPPLIYLLYRFGWRALAAPITLIGCSSIVLIAIYAYFEIDPFILMKLITRGLNDPGASTEKMQKYMDYIYIKPYCRIQPYLVGFILGYAFNMSYRWMKKPGWVVTLTGWFVAAVVGLMIVYAPHYAVIPNSKDWNLAQMTVYGTFERLVWGLILAWVTYACHYKAGGLVHKFLSANFWIPLSRLTYSVYLIHLILLPVMFTGAMGTIHFDLYTASYYYISAVVLSYAAGFILSVAVEFPCDNLENLAINYIKKAYKMN